MTWSLRPRPPKHCLTLYMHMHTQMQMQCTCTCNAHVHAITRHARARVGNTLHSRLKLLLYEVTAEMFPLRVTSALDQHACSPFVRELLTSHCYAFLLKGYISAHTDWKSVTHLNTRPRNSELGEQQGGKKSLKTVHAMALCFSIQRPFECSGILKMIIELIQVTCALPKCLQNTV